MRACSPEMVELAKRAGHVPDEDDGVVAVLS